MQFRRFRNQIYRSSDNFFVYFFSSNISVVDEKYSLIPMKFDLLWFWKIFLWRKISKNVWARKSERVVTDVNWTVYFITPFKIFEISEVQSRGNEYIFIFEI